MLGYWAKPKGLIWEKEGGCWGLVSSSTFKPYSHECYVSIPAKGD